MGVINKRFFCIDAHTCGNPVRVVAGGAPLLQGRTMMERRLEFIEHFDWIRQGLMFEPRGHDMMSGTLIYPPADPQNDVGILFIETSGCLPMCGHGTIGTVTVLIEEQLVVPKVQGVLRLEVPAGLVIARYTQEQGKVTSVAIENVPSFLFQRDLEIESPQLGPIRFDVAYGGNFYAIIDPQPNFAGLEHYSASDLILMARALRTAINERYTFQHPSDPDICGLRHIQWTGAPLAASSSARNAVFYGEKAIDRSPCGTGTSARMAQWAALGKLNEGDVFIHESIIGSTFEGRIAARLKVGEYDAIIPEIRGWARIYGYNTLTIDETDPYAFGFSVV
ncbi:MAG: 4-hydroxyproline epimerase [Acidobacteria bacterium]|nr:4-hydroxyproline epimerase [Acidobacteriota bacterium]MCB9399291.1 4-hydroxyproline epimerase [Acidobacteriota bacterium]